MTTDSACPEVELLELYVVGHTSDAEAQRLEEHLRGCPRCIDQLPSLGEGDDLVQTLRAQKNKPPPTSAAIDQLRERLLGLRLLVATAAFPDTDPSGLDATPSPGDSRKVEEDARALLRPAQGADETGRLGPYRVLCVLGAGGMGVVFEAEDPQLQRNVALKAMRPDLATNGDARQRFLREAQRMATLTHDHVLAIHHVGEDHGVPFLAMPLLQGESLEDRLRREGQLPVAEVLRIGRETALGLSAAHERGVIHRDVKPANLWLEASSGRVKILDFGLARLAEGDADLTGSGVIVGTPSYLAPEQAEGAVDPRADLFSLGCVLYRMVTGRLAFPGKTRLAALRAVATLNPIPPRQINPETPEALSRLIEQLLSKDRADRPASASVVAQALKEIKQSASTSVPLTPTETLVAAPPSGRRRWRWFSVAGLLLAGVVALGTFAFWPGHPQKTDIGTVPAKLEVLSLDVKHFATVKSRRDPRGRLLGKDSFVTHVDDSVEVAAWLSRPAYAFLIAFRPDGTAMLCFPEKEDEKPPRTDRPRFPSVSTDSDYALEEGAGLQVFALVVSSQPLPSFKGWWSRQGCPWGKSESPPEVVWRSYGGVAVEGLTADPSGPRGKRAVQGKAAVARLADWLSKRPQVEAVAVLGFAVMPKGKP
jgi:serine/threonine protein kinase